LDSLRLFFENLAIEWDASQPPNRDDVLARLIAPFDNQLRASSSILEVGTGTGALIPILKARYPSSHLVSMDLAHRMLSKAQSRVPGAALVQADAHHPPFVDQSFDAIVCHNAFPHFWWPETALSAFHRMLVPGGIFLILHDLSREKVNSIHGTAKNPIIHNDLLPTGQTLAKTLEKMKFSPLLVEDRSDRYIIYAKSEPILLFEQA
jgi:CsoR family transcriptional regulator, copper-sensing transcriptional repressor